MANETATSNIALVGLQNQLDTVRSEVISTNTNVQTIGRLIQTDNFEDQRRLIEERNQERLLAEREIRSIDEERLRQKVDAAVTAPVRRLEKKINSSFTKIGVALGTLFGSIKDTTIQGIRFTANLGIKSFKGIGSLIKTSLSAIASTFEFFSSGFSSVIKGIGKITSTVLGAIADLAKSPFKAIADVFKKLLPGTPKPTPPAELPPASGLGGLGRLLGAGVRLAGSVFSGFTAIDRAQQGDIGGAGLAGLGIISPWAAAASFGYGLLKDNNIIKNIDMKSIQNIFTSGGESVKKFLGSAGINFNDLGFDKFKNTISGAFNSLPFFQQSKSQSKPQQLETVPFQAPPSSPPPSSTPPSPPDIVYVGGNSSQQSAVVSGGDSSAVTDVPLISSSNPNNFYTLYSQVNYNVVI